MPKSVAERSDVLPALGECFREHGYEGASLALIGEATGLGKGSLYHFFPGGKEEMASAVLAEIDAWFEQYVFAPLRETERPDDGIAAMFDAVETYFRSGRRVCLVGAFALGETRDRFARRVRAYFTRWIDALRTALIRAGRDPACAAALSEEVVAGIQGAIVLARALGDPKAFARAAERLRRAALST
ncbi:MAG TPA: TetR/AcrR family transcriptional regulator [Candidatus Limnocylindria bacterium]|jgi:TetR/AcrR family transcriptional repressor of lmrAB and yxaGH operons|nr:TetR/AcrR family transcriptional regulator [Candidatus Limnocylindria bacterium]